MFPRFRDAVKIEYVIDVNFASNMKYIVSWLFDTDLHAEKKQGLDGVFTKNGSWDINSLMLMFTIIIKGIIVLTDLRRCGVISGVGELDIMTLSSSKIQVIAPTVNYQKTLRLTNTLHQSPIFSNYSYIPPHAP